MLLYNDVPMEIVSELLGHSNMKITQEYYGKVVQRRVSEEIKRISGYFGSFCATHFGVIVPGISV